MAKGIIKNYTFVTASKTITLTDITTVRLDKLALITDVTTNKILYNFADLTVATATVATNVITLSVLQGGEAGTDKLRIDYDVESSDTTAFADTTQPVSLASVPSHAVTNAGTFATQVTTINGVAPAFGTGVRGATVQRVTIATDDLVPVTANAGTNLNTSALALDATLTGGTAKSIVRGGAKGATTAADVTSTSQSADRNALDVQIRTSAGVVVDSFGGGTQFADGAARGTATGTIAMVDDGTNIQSMKGDTSGRPAMNIEQINGITPLMGNGVTGTGSQRVTIASDNTAFSVNANAGTNLNTSALNLETTQTAMSAKLPATLGQKAMAASMAVVLASDQASIPVAATLAAETTKVIGTVNQGTSPWVTSNATTSVVGNGAAATAQRVTLANDSTGIIATVGAVTAITNALPAGTNAIGKLAANSGVDIGDVDVTSVIPGTLSTNLGKAVDNVAGATDTGVLSLAVRDDALTTLTPIDGDYTQTRTNARGALWTALDDGLGAQIGTTTGGTAVSGLNTAVNATVFAFSTVNSTTAQLASGAKFTGTVESVVSQQSYSILLFSDQDGTLTINQFTDAGGTKLNQTLVYAVTKNVGFARSGVVNGNYAQIVFQNNGNATTTNLQIDTAFGTIPAATPLNNAPVAINEINGTALTIGQNTMAKSIPVVLPNDAGDVKVSSNVLSEILLELQALNGSMGISSYENKNMQRELDDNAREVITLANTPDNIRTTNTTITASTTETTIIAGSQGVDNRLLALIISNTSASTNTRVDIRDATGGAVRFSLQSIGGANPVGFSLGGVAIPQLARGGDWTVTCATSTTDIRVTAVYSVN